MDGAVIVIGLVMGVVWAIVGNRIAAGKGRGVALWTIVCFLTGLIGVVIVAVLPSKRVAEVAAAPEPAPDAWLEELRKLSELHDTRALSDEEFAHEKERVLAHR